MNFSVSRSLVDARFPAASCPVAGVKSTKNHTNQFSPDLPFRASLAH
jgi:hypothetical protein